MDAIKTPLLPLCLEGHILRVSITVLKLFEYNMHLDKNDYKRGNKIALFSSLVGNNFQVLHFYFMLEFRTATRVTAGKKK